MYNESKDIEGNITPIQPTPVIGMVGIIDNVKKAISSSWKDLKDEIWIIGSESSEITVSASSYLEYIHGKILGRPPKIDLLDEKTIQKFIREGILNDLIVSSHDVSDGGLSLALSECCIFALKGATIELDQKGREDNLLFGEGGSRIIFSINHEKIIEWHKFLKKYQAENTLQNIYIKKIGYVEKDVLKIKISNKEICNLKVCTLADKFNNELHNKFAS